MLVHAHVGRVTALGFVRGGGGPGGEHVLCEMLARIRTL